MNCYYRKNCPENLECEAGKDKIFIDDCPSFVEACEAFLSHGPGHQSRSMCMLTGEHSIHRAVYGKYEQEAEWLGNQASTDYFNNPRVLQNKTV